MAIKVGITGVLGYIGSVLSKKLIDNSYEVIGIDNFLRNKIESIESLKVFKGDIRDFKFLEKTLKDVDIIIHLAAYSGVKECKEDPDQAIDVNINGTTNICWLCGKYKIPLIFPSTVAIFGTPNKFPITENNERKPLNLYGVTKYIGEELIKLYSKLYDFPVYILTKTNVYGEAFVDGIRITKENVINHFSKKIIKNEEINLFKPGTQGRDFLHLKDAAEVYYLAINSILKEKNYEHFIIGEGKSTSMLEVINLIKEVAKDHKFELKLKMMDNPRNEVLIDNFLIDNSKASNTLKFKPKIKIKDAIKEIFDNEMK